jgi:hypothetical protein
LVKKVVEKIGHRVMEAENRKFAWQMFLEHSPEMVTIRLPGKIYQFLLFGFYYLPYSPIRISWNTIPELSSERLANSLMQHLEFEL